MFDGPELRFIGLEGVAADELASIRRDLATLYATPEGTCPGDRSFGIDLSFLDYPLDVAQNMYALELIDKTEEYVRGVEVLGVSLDWGTDGHMRASVLIGPDEEDDTWTYEERDEMDDPDDE